MAITTYAELQTAVGNWLNRTDLTTAIPDFITLAEAKMKRRVRHWRMESRATAETVAGQRTLALPNGYIEMRNLKINATHVDVLEFLPPSVMYENSSAQGQPKYYTVQGDQLVLEPVPDSAYEIEMGYLSFDVLSDSNTSNWVLTNHPDLYLYGTLLEAAAYIKDNDYVPVWKSGYDLALREILKDDKSGRWNGTPLIMRIEA